MAQAGILGEDDRVELIQGEIIEMSPIGSTHAGCVTRLTMSLARELDERFAVGVQNPVRLDASSEPQPDISIYRTRAGSIVNETPTPDTVVLLIEVADSSYDYDHRVKLPLYARAGIAEYWIVDIPGGAIERHTAPINTTYSHSTRATRGQALASTMLPEVILDVDRVLG